MSYNSDYYDNGSRYGDRPRPLFGAYGRDNRAQPPNWPQQQQHDIDQQYGYGSGDPTKATEEEDEFAQNYQSSSRYAPHFRARISNEQQNGFNYAQASREQMERSLYHKNSQERRREAVRKGNEFIRGEQEKTRFGQKQVGIDDEFSDDDPDFQVMNEVRSLLEPAPPQIIIQQVMVQPKKKKHKRRHSSSSSSSRSSSRERKKKKKKDKKEKKKRRRRSRSSEREEERRPNEAGTSRRRETVSEFHVSENPWSKLSKQQLRYQPSHLVIDPRPAPENLQYPGAYKRDNPSYFDVSKKNDKFVRAFSEQFPELMYNEMEETSGAKEERYFGEKTMRNWDRRPAERIFRSLGDSEFGEFTELSMTPCVEQEGNVKKEEIDQNKWASMTLEDFVHVKKREETSYEEAVELNLDTVYSHAQAKTVAEPEKVENWVELINLKKSLQAKNESGDPNAPLQNKKAYFEQVKAVVDLAMTKVKGQSTRAQLQLKMLTVMEEYFGAGAANVKDAWATCENKYASNLELWRSNIRMRLSDRVFSTKQMVLLKEPSGSRLPLLDHCIQNLANIKMGIKRSHRPEPGTEEFLVELLVQRCALLLATGHIFKAVAQLQALIEFHMFRHSSFNFFRPQVSPLDRLNTYRKQFGVFWRSGVPRCGDENAKGWDHFVEENEVPPTAENDEKAMLDDIYHAYITEEKTVRQQFQQNGYTIVEARRRLDRFRARFFWMPLRFVHEDDELYEFKDRVVDFKEIEQLVFPFDEPRLAQELIFRLLNLFGVQIPGFDFVSQQSVLRCFSRREFPDTTSPNSMQLHGYDTFFEQLLRKLAESPKMDEQRIYPALALRISNSPESVAMRYKALHKFIRTINKQLPVKKDGEESNEELVLRQNTRSLQLSVTAFEEMTKLKEEMREAGDTEGIAKLGNFELETCVKMLHMHLDTRKRNFWALAQRENTKTEPGLTEEEQEKIRAERKAALEKTKRERILCLRLFTFLARQLPFSNERSAYDREHIVRIKQEEKNDAAEVVTAAVVVPLRTKRELLLSFWANGNVTEVTETKQIKDRAKKRIAEFNEKPMPIINLEQEAALRWCGDENELLYEMAALGMYEFEDEVEVAKDIDTVGNEEKWNKRTKMFADDGHAFYAETAIGRLLEGRTVQQEVRVRILQHILVTEPNYTPGDFHRQLTDLALRHPTSVPILKALLDASNSFNLRRFLATNPGQEGLPHLVRTCGRVYAEKQRFNRTMMVSILNSVEWSQREMKTRVRRLVRLLRRAAEQHSSNNAFPDDYLWHVLMTSIFESLTFLSETQVEEAFLIGQQLCPWSKDLLFEAVRSCFDLTHLNASITTHGLWSWCNDKEVETMFTLTQ